MLSLVIPVYKNEENLDRLLSAVGELSEQVKEGLEVAFVVDGSPDQSLEVLGQRLPGAPFRSQLLSLSRNFGSFAAIAAGLQAATGDYFAVMAADLQEPPQLVLEFLKALRSDEADVVFGCRAARADPLLSELSSNFFWWVYRTFVVKDMPKGGVDVFACTREVRDRLLQFREVNSNLIALLFWLGYRRRFISYERQSRLEGKSAWTLGKKLRYSLDSIFNFTDLPIRVLLYTGTISLIFSLLFALVVLATRLLGRVPVPGYTVVVLAIMLFGALTSLGFGIVGQYLWLALQNTRGRPAFVVASSQRFLCEGRRDGPESAGTSRVTTAATSRSQ